MNGSIDLERFPYPAGKIVANEFAEGKECEKLYGEVYEANRRICSRLGVDEDQDVETIISCMDDICRILAYRMFDYGTKKENFIKNSKGIIEWDEKAKGVFHSFVTI